MKVKTLDELNVKELEKAVQTYIKEPHIREKLLDDMCSFYWDENGGMYSWEDLTKEQQDRIDEG